MKYKMTWIGLCSVILVVGGIVVGAGRTRVDHQGTERFSKKTPRNTIPAVTAASGGREESIHKSAVAAASRASETGIPMGGGAMKILQGAGDEVKRGTRYLETYEVIPYPQGDVSPEIGVCTDLVIRAFRRTGVDLQRRIHEDRKTFPGAYPVHLWDYKKPDRNIDHRRCQNLYVFFRRHAQSLTTDSGAPHRSEWRPGDVVFFRRQGAEFPWHVAIIADVKNPDGSLRILHLFPPKAAEAALDDYGPIHSHFRWIE